MSGTTRPVLYWLRQDLRLADNPALLAALEAVQRLNAPLLMLFSAANHGERQPGGASLWWLDKSLRTLSADIAAKGGSLNVVTAPVTDIIDWLNPQAVFWNRRYEPGAVEHDRALMADLKARDITVKSFNSHLLNEPWETETKTGGPYKVFTPYWKTIKAGPEPALPEPAPDNLSCALSLRRIAVADTASSAPGITPLHVDELGWHPRRPDWSGGMAPVWTPGEAGALQNLDHFLSDAVADYDAGRDLPGISGTSRLSPHLRWGEISPRTVWHSTREAMHHIDGADKSGWRYLSEIAWREFAYHLLHHFPDIGTVNFNRKFDAFDWQPDEEMLLAWQQGRTGYPFVDAGMRQLWQTGWMHNRVRMVTASFLIKHLLQDWRTGEAWFWDCLVDADPAINTASWQWVAGSGADAAPYFRIFNPVTQGDKFDSDGIYTRRFVPEVRGVADRFVHGPWLSGSPLLTPVDPAYPAPVVDHKAARDRALKAYETVKLAGT